MIYKANFAADESAQRLDLRGVQFIYRNLWRLLLRGGVLGLHLSERLIHFAEDPNRVGNRIRRTFRKGKDVRRRCERSWALVAWKPQARS